MYSQQQANQYAALSASMVGEKMSLPVKTTLTTEDIKEIVQRLNTKPFNESYNLVTFDELSA
jgi:hypothetical protein